MANTGGFCLITLFIFQMILGVDAIEYLSQASLLSFKRCVSNSPTRYNYTLLDDALYIVLNEREFEEQADGKDFILDQCIKKYAKDADITVVFDPDGIPVFENEGLLSDEAWKVVMLNGISKISDNHCKKDTNQFENFQKENYHESDYSDGGKIEDATDQAWRLAMLNGTSKTSHSHSKTSSKMSFNQNVQKNSIKSYGGGDGDSMNESVVIYALRVAVPEEEEEFLFDLYEAHTSVYKGCVSSSMEQCQVAHCYSENSPYRSVRFYSEVELKGWVFYHHDCNRSRSSVTVPANGWSKCHDKWVYSWKLYPTVKKRRHSSFMDAIRNSFLNPKKNARNLGFRRRKNQS